MTTYTAEYFIRKFEAIPEEKWCVNEFRAGRKKCALGHCGVRANTPVKVDAVDHFGSCPWGIPAADALHRLVGQHFSSGVGHINDGEHPLFKQPTPKARILAALSDILVREKTERRLAHGHVHRR
jgi:hypothetical protein